MHLKEIRSLLVLFLKQFNKQDLSLLLNYLPIFIEDIQRDPLLLDKIPDSNEACFNEQVNQNQLIDVIDDKNNNSLTNNMLAYESYDEDEDDDSNETSRSLYCTIKSQPPRYTNNIVDYLYKMYNLNKYPKADDLYKMSLEINLAPKKIQTWFSNTRFKLKHSKSHDKNNNETNSKTKTNKVDDDKSEGSNSLSIDESEPDKKFSVNHSNESYLDSNHSLASSNLQSNEDELENLIKVDDEKNDKVEEEEKNDEEEEDEEKFNVHMLALSKTRLPIQTLEYLVTKYKENKYPTAEEIYKISLDTHLTAKKVKTWFDSTRFKLKHSKRTFHMNKSHIEFLTNKLAINNNPSSRDIEVMACQINLTETQIYHWFYQKRKHMK